MRERCREKHQVLPKYSRSLWCWLPWAMLKLMTSGIVLLSRRSCICSGNVPLKNVFLAKFLEKMLSSFWQWVRIFSLSVEYAGQSRRTCSLVSTIPSVEQLGLVHSPPGFAGVQWRVLLPQGYWKLKKFSWIRALETSFMGCWKMLLKACVDD